jgi:hypothetical protein
MSKPLVKIAPGQAGRRAGGDLAALRYGKAILVQRHTVTRRRRIVVRFSGS